MVGCFVLSGFGYLHFYFPLNPLAQSNFGDSPVVVINDLPVSMDEFNVYLNRNIAGTHNYFHGKYGDYNADHFWRRSFNGEVPIEYLKKTILDHLIYIKTLQKYAMDIDLIPEYDFHDVQEWWGKDNDVRLKKYANGDVVFGPIETSLEEYTDYLYSNLEIRLQEYLNKNHCIPSECQLETFYEQIKNDHFVYTPGIKVEMLIFDCPSFYDKVKIEKRAHIAKDKMNQGAPMESFVSTRENVQYFQRTFSDTIQIIGEENPDHDIKFFALQLRENENDVFYSRNNAAVYLIQCRDRLDDQVWPFDKVKSDVVYYYQEREYKNLMEQLTQNADVRINKRRYNRIQFL